MSTPLIYPTSTRIPDDVNPNAKCGCVKSCEKCKKPKRTYQERKERRERKEEKRKSKRFNLGGSGCLSTLLLILLFWAWVFGVTYGGHHYSIGCNSNGVEIGVRDHE